MEVERVSVGLFLLIWGREDCEAPLGDVLKSDVIKHACMYLSKGRVAISRRRLRLMDIR
jgi:hypothetical protein